LRIRKIVTEREYSLMLDGARRLASIFALTFLLTPSPSLMAGTESRDSREVIAQNSSTSSKRHGPRAKVPITPQAKAEAAEIFENRCITCHGEQGSGDGPAASNLNPKPIDFHKASWQKSVDDATIARAIIYGGSAVGVSAQMASNPDLEGEPAVVQVLVERIRSFGK
jgi:hypothetical protein